MKYDVQLCEVLRRVQTAENTFDYTVLVPKLAEVAQPGQFAHIYVPINNRDPQNSGYPFL